MIVRLILGPLFTAVGRAAVASRKRNHPPSCVLPTAPVEAGAPPRAGKEQEAEAMIGQISAHKFALGWIPALAVAANVDPVPTLADALVVHWNGVPIPLLTCAIGAVGVLSARPLARRAESTLSLPMFVLVSFIMLLLAQLWIIDSRPGLLFAFVVSLGLGFAGYAVIEAVGEQVTDFARNLVNRAAGRGQAKD
jgi:hypothetical protein